MTDEIHWESANHGMLRLDGRTIGFTIHDRDATGGWIEIDERVSDFMSIESAIWSRYGSAVERIVWFKFGRGRSLMIQAKYAP